MKNNRTKPTLRTPEELLIGVPYLLGFHPQESMVAVVVRANQLHVTARWDLDIAMEESGLRWINERLSGLCQVQDTKVLLIGYGDRTHVQEVMEVILGTVAVEILDALVVDQDQWWFANEDQRRPGRSLPQGIGVPSSRSELASSIAPPRGHHEDEGLQILVEFLDSHDDRNLADLGKSVVCLMERWRKGDPLSDKDYIEAGLAMYEGVARDELWKVLTHDLATSSLQFWKEVLRRTPAVLRIPALAVTGMVAWIAGEGALMNICLEEAEALDGSFPLVVTLGMISQQGLHPSTWIEINSEPLVRAS